MCFIQLAHFRFQKKHTWHLCFAEFAVIVVSHWLIMIVMVAWLSFTPQRPWPGAGRQLLTGERLKSTADWPWVQKPNAPVMSSGGFVPKSSESCQNFIWFPESSPFTKSSHRTDGMTSPITTLEEKTWWGKQEEGKWKKQPWIAKRNKERNLHDQSCKGI